MLPIRFPPTPSTSIGVSCLLVPGWQIIIPSPSLNVLVSSLSKLIPPPFLLLHHLTRTSLLSLYRSHLCSLDQYSVPSSNHTALYHLTRPRAGLEGSVRPVLWSSLQTLWGLPWCVHVKLRDSQEEWQEAWWGGGVCSARLRGGYPVALGGNPKVLI